MDVTASFKEVAELEFVILEMFKVNVCKTTPQNVNFTYSLSTFLKFIQKFEIIFQLNLKFIVSHL